MEHNERNLVEVDFEVHRIDEGKHLLELSQKHF